MDARRLIADVLKEAARLGLSSWERLVLVLALALLLVMGRRGIDAIRAVELEPQEPRDEGGALPPGTSFPSQPENDGHGTFGG